MSEDDRVLIVTMSGNRAPKKVVFIEASAGHLHNNCSAVSCEVLHARQMADGLISIRCASLFN